MATGRLFLEDIIDVIPFVEKANELVYQCCIAAYAFEDREYDSDAKDSQKR